MDATKRDDFRDDLLLDRRRVSWAGIRRQPFTLMLYVMPSRQQWAEMTPRQRLLHLVFGPHLYPTQYPWTQN